MKENVISTPPLESLGLRVRQIYLTEGWAANFCKEHFPDKKVSGGPFRGLQYLEYKSCESPLVPKFLGTYEAELHQIIYRLIDYCNNKKCEIINIGCAEGYYAIGMALKCPDSKITAFDINEESVEYAHKMAILNGVAEQITFESLCTKKTLLDLPADRSDLIISDIEGAEQRLFTKDVARHLRNYRFLIEVHDAYDINCFGNVKLAFSDTHKITIIPVLSDYRKTYEYAHSMIDAYCLEDKYRLFREYREDGQWFYCEPL